jgi:hypothetical protein
MRESIEYMRESIEYMHESIEYMRESIEYMRKFKDIHRTTERRHFLQQHKTVRKVTTDNTNCTNRDIITCRNALSLQRYHSSTRILDHTPTDNFLLFLLFSHNLITSKSKERCPLHQRDQFTTFHANHQSPFRCQHLRYGSTYHQSNQWLFLQHHERNCLTEKHHCK